MLDAEVSQLLTLLNDTFPPVHEMTGTEARALVAARRQPVDNLSDVARTEERQVPGPLGDVPVRVYWPHGDSAGPRPVILFLHGGGFVFCDVKTHDGFCRMLSRHTRSVVVSVDYRLAPENHAPAAAEDAYAALKWTRAAAGELGVDPDRVVVAGDSAGGNLAAVVALMCRERGPALAGQVLLYPVIDPGCDTPSYHSHGEGYFNTRAAMEWYWRQYLGAGLPEPAYLAAPARAESHRGLAPAVVVTAGLDPLHSEGVAYARTLRAADVPVVHRDYPGLFHGFLTIAPLTAAASARELLWSDIDELISRKVDA